MNSHKTGASIPNEFPLDELVGQEVTQVCVGAAYVQIHFLRQSPTGAPDSLKPLARIDVEAAFTIETAASTSIRVEPQLFKYSGQQLTKLLGETVSEVCREPNNELSLEFSNGFVLRLHTDPLGFESFHLHVGGESITVTST